MGWLENFVVDRGAAVRLKVAGSFAYPYKPLVQVDDFQPVGELFAVSILDGTADIIFPKGEHLHVPARVVYLFNDADVASD